MEEIYHPTQPNTTQIPHTIIRDWMPRLKDVELRVLLVVADQTLGWIEDTETGRRKEKDWISQYQLIVKTGKKERGLSRAIKTLVDDHRIIEAFDEHGKRLDSPQKRSMNGGKIFYRLSLRQPHATLFDTPAKKTGVRVPPQILRPQKVRTTKETVITKVNTLQPAKPIAGNKAVEKSAKPLSNHSRLVYFYHEATKAARNINPTYGQADFKAIKRLLDKGIPTDTLQQCILFFLYDPGFKTFSPTLKTIFSNGVITGLMNRTKNDPEFWKKLDRYSSYRGIQKALDGNPREIAETAKNLSALKASLLGSFASKAIEKVELETL